MSMLNGSAFAGSFLFLGENADLIRREYVFLPNRTLIQE